MTLEISVVGQTGILHSLQVLLSSTLALHISLNYGQNKEVLMQMEWIWANLHEIPVGSVGLLFASFVVGVFFPHFSSFKLKNKK